MPILVTCQSCDRELRAPDAFRERAARCPNCGSVVRLSTGTQDSPDSRSEPEEPHREEYLPTAGTSAAPAITSALLGALAALTVCFWMISLPAALLAIVFGLVALARIYTGRGRGEGLAIAGLVSGLLTLGLLLLLLVLSLLGAAAINL